MNDRKFLEKATKLAELSLNKGSVPIGAVIVDENNKIISKGYNEIKTNFDATAHAEVVAIRDAKKKVLRKFNKNGTTLYTTLEPCFACAFFITRTNIRRVVWALSDPYKGGIDFLKKSKKMKDDLKSIEFVVEPIKDLKKKSKKMMFEYYSKKGKEDIALNFK